MREHILVILRALGSHWLPMEPCGLTFGIIRHHLGPIWCVLGDPWAYLGTILETLGIIMETSGSILACLGHLNPT